MLSLHVDIFISACNFMSIWLCGVHYLGNRGYALTEETSHFTL